LIGRRARARRAHEQLAAVGEREVASVGAVRIALGAIAFHDDLGADRQRILRQAPAQQHRRIAPFDHPPLDLAIRALHVDVNPGVGVDPFHLRHGAAQRDGLVRVEFRGKRVVRRQTRRADEQAQARSAKNPENET
jgi:hypothetical protein